MLRCKLVLHLIITYAVQILQNHLRISPVNFDTTVDILAQKVAVPVRFISSRDNYI